MRLPLATANGAASFWAWTAALIALAIVAPFFLYPIFLMNALCMALHLYTVDLALRGGSRRNWRFLSAWRLPPRLD